MTKTIMIIDDEPDILTLTCIRLHSEGYSCLTSLNAEDAFDIMKKMCPDLVLLDLKLPKMQGDEFCRKIKMSKEYSHVPVIIFTANAAFSPEELKRSMADDYIVKPFEAADLTKKIARLLDRPVKG